MLPKLTLFDSKKDFGIFLGAVFLILLINIALKYHTYTELKSHKVYQTSSVVINQYQKTKHNKTYIVF